MVSRLIGSSAIVCRSTAALVLAISLSGCRAEFERSSPIGVTELARELTVASGIPLTARSPPAGTPGIPELKTTLSGGSRREWIAALVFFDAAGATRMLGGDNARVGVTIARRENVVVMYHTSPPADDKSPQLRLALTRVSSTR